jgi:predicted cation transporter
VFLFLVIAVLGLLSSVITAIIASLVLVEIVQALPFERTYKIRLCIIACFSIGLGAALTPVGEPLATIVVSLLDQDFFFLLRTLGVYIVPGVLLLALFGAVAVGRDAVLIHHEEMDEEDPDCPMAPAAESFSSIVMRAAKIFLFIIALELLGAGFKPLINTYIIHLDSMLLYWINMISAVLDNATLAAAEISPLMGQEQIKAILMGLLISGGMLIPGNIPNIISACKLDIGSKEWAKLGVPLGLAIMLIYFLELFIFKIA